MTLSSFTTQISSELISCRRELHQIPEVGLHLPQTRQYILDALEGLPLEIATGTGLTEAPGASAAGVTITPRSPKAQIKDLQTRLSRLGYWLGTPDGVYGALTTQAVYAVQKAAGLSRDGVVGPRTWPALLEFAVAGPF